MPTMRRKLLAAGAVLLLLAVGVGAAAYKVLSKEDPPQKRGSAGVEFDPSAKPDKRSAKKKAAVPWPTFGFDRQRTKAAPFDHHPPYKRTWRVDGKDTLEFPPAASFHRQLAEEPKNATLLTDALYEVTGRRLAVAFAVGEDEEAEALDEPTTEEEFVSLLKDTFDAREVQD